jgi:hypothetical protein
VAILLTYGMARVLLAGDAEGREEEYMASGPYTGALTVVNVPNYKTIRDEISCPAGGRRRRAVGIGEIVDSLGAAIAECHGYAGIHSKLQNFPTSGFAHS